MKPSPIPLVPSGLSVHCPDVLGKTLVIRGCTGWQWTHHVDGKVVIVTDECLMNAEFDVIPEEYVPFTTPRCGIFGRVATSPLISVQQFLAFIMSDGWDYNFTSNIAPIWRVMIGEGSIDMDSEWFPILTGPNVYFGYGTVAADRKHLPQRTNY